MSASSTRLAPAKLFNAWHRTTKPYRNAQTTGDLYMNQSTGHRNVTARQGNGGRRTGRIAMQDICASRIEITARQLADSLTCAVPGETATNPATPSDLSRRKCSEQGHALPCGFRSTKRIAGRGFDSVSGRHEQSMTVIKCTNSDGAWPPMAQ